MQEWFDIIRILILHMQLNCYEPEFRVRTKRHNPEKGLSFK